MDIIKPRFNKSNSDQVLKTNSFVAFQNERDYLGRLVSPRKKKKDDFDILCIFEVN